MGSGGGGPMRRGGEIILACLTVISQEQGGDTERQSTQKLGNSTFEHQRKIKNLVLSANVADETNWTKIFPSRTFWKELLAISNSHRGHRFDQGDQYLDLRQPRKSWNETLALWILFRPDDSIELELRLWHSDVTDLSPSDENLDWRHAIVHGCKTHEIGTWLWAIDSANVFEFQCIM